jgi:G3E family GTPase
MKNEGQIPFYLITGFLGSGKTTLLKHILHQYASKLRLAIVQNEFAPASVDGAELKQTGDPMELLEINNGSVFCVCLLDDFIGQLSDFVERVKPDVLLMEASGLSDPIGIAEILQQEKVAQRIRLAGIWCVLDAVNSLKVVKMNRQLRNQVMIADELLVNKSDLAGEEQLNDVVRCMQQWNPFAQVRVVTHCVVDHLFSAGNSGVPVALSQADHHKKIEASGRPDIDMGVMKSGRKISRERLLELLNDFAPDTYRIKGFVNLKNGKHLTVQTSFKQVALHDLDGYSGPTQLIGLGEGFDIKAFARQYRALSE